jgi:glycosyltransferase involved in cell wall biosynthesis
VTVPQLIFAAITIPICLMWCYLYGGTLFRIRQVKLLKDEHPPRPAVFPRLSVVVPACNEAATLESALASLRAQTYPNLEIVLIDDRSTDGTGAIVDRIAARDPRIVPVHLTELPAGWLGKVHAFHRASRTVTGEYVLYTDADIHFGPGLLEKSVALMLHEQLDHLTYMPDLKPSTFLLQAVQASFGATLFMMSSVHLVGRPGTKHYIGVGAFNMVKKSAFDRSETFEWLKMEPADDFALGAIMHRAGGKGGFRVAIEELSVEWYPTTYEMVKGLEKNTFGPLCNYSLLPLFPMVAAALALFLGPFVLFAFPPLPWMRVFPILAFLAVPLGFSGIRSRLHLKILPALFAPFAGQVLIFALLRSALLCTLRGGISWRGTLYSKEELKRARRIDLSTGRVRTTS